MENKTGKYFKYAIGEIVLLVIGILIALSINNWKEQKKANIEKNQLVNSLTKELKILIPDLEEKIQIWESRGENLSNVIELLYRDGEKTPIDSIKQHIATAFLGVPYTPQIPSYTAAVNSGKIKLIDDFIFLSNMSEFLQSEKYYNKFLQIHLEMAFTGILWDIKKKHYDLYEPDQYMPDEYSLNDKEYINYVSRPDVIATFKNVNSLRRNIISHMNSMLESSKKIVQNFELQK